MSEERSRQPHHVEDLSVLSRRGALSAADQRAFAEAVDASATLATAHQLGLDFDQVTTVKPGDDTLIAQVAARTVSRAPTRGGGRWRLRGLLLVAALALAGSATALLQRHRSPAPVAPSSVAHLAASATAALVQAQPAAPTPSVAPTATAEAEVPTASPRLVPTPNAPSSAPGSTANVGDANPHGLDSAEALFREANAARRAGDSAASRALYLRLEHDFPESDEAHLAHVSLGNLLLTMGRAAEAERQFASYVGGRASLAQEALVGRAQSLASLGRSDEERRVWQTLLHEYPTSVYADRAKLRLAVLAGSAAHPD